MKYYVKQALSFLADLVFVKRCPCCGNAISLDTDICRDCFNDLLIPKNICNVCGEPKKECICAKKRILYKGFTAPFYNLGSAQVGVYSYKFNANKYAARFFAKQMVKRFKRVFPNATINLVVSVPRNPNKRNNENKRKNRFDHSALLAKEVALCLKVPYKSRVLKKIRNNLAQHTLKYEERAKNVENAYRARVNLQGKCVLLIDDIKTTGSTLNECAKQLLLAGAESVYCLTAVASPKSHENKNNAEQNKN